MHLGERDGERESGAKHRVGEAVRRNVGGGAERYPIRVQDRAFGYHLNLFLEFAVARRAVDAAATCENGVAAAPPIDGVARRGSEEGEQPVGLQVDGGDGRGCLVFGSRPHRFGQIGRPHGSRCGLVGGGWHGGTPPGALPSEPRPSGSGRAAASGAASVTEAAAGSAAWGAASATGAVSGSVASGKASATGAVSGSVASGKASATGAVSGSVVNRSLTVAAPMEGSAPSVSGTGW